MKTGNMKQLFQKAVKSKLQLEQYTLASAPISVTLELMSMFVLSICLSICRSDPFSLITTVFLALSLTAIVSHSDYKQSGHQADPH